MSEIAKVCGFCGKTPARLKTCTRCKRSKYCNSECQKSDWPGHKLKCFPIPKPSKEETDVVLVDGFPVKGLVANPNHKRDFITNKILMDVAMPYILSDETIAKREKFHEIATRCVVEVELEYNSNQGQTKSFTVLRVEVTDQIDEVCERCDTSRLREYYNTYDTTNQIAAIVWCKNPDAAYSFLSMLVAS